MDLLRTSKEIARHIMHVAGMRRRRQDHLKVPTRAARFSKIYDDGVWSFGRQDIPLSGNGSSLKATENVRSTLPEMLRRLGVGTLVDVGCGDFTWMRQIDLPCDYVGVDIVPWLVNRNSEQFGSSERRFVCADVVTTAAPKGDLVLCREVLFHLSLDNGISALRNMLASGCSHLLITTDRATGFNAEIDSGDFRLINLERSPYGLPEPLERIDDNVISMGRFMGLWSADDVQSALGTSRVPRSGLE